MTALNAGRFAGEGVAHVPKCPHDARRRYVPNRLNGFALPPVLRGPVNDRFPLPGMKWILFEIAIRHGEVEHRSQEFQFAIDRGHRALLVARTGLSARWDLKSSRSECLRLTSFFLPKYSRKLASQEFGALSSRRPRTLRPLTYFASINFFCSKIFRQILEGYLRRIEALGRFLSEPLVGGLLDFFQSRVSFFAGFSMPLPLPDFPGNGMGRRHFGHIALITLAPKNSPCSRFRHLRFPTDFTH
jgi:hypothetical protein